MRKASWAPAGFALALLASCADYPRDMAGTFERVRDKGELRIGLTAMSAIDRARERRFVARLEQVSGARAKLSTGAAEHQLALLEDGKLDLVIGEFAEDSPWLTDVAVIEPLSTRVVGGRKIGLSPVAANGENRWVMLIERTVRDGKSGR